MSCSNQDQVSSDSFEDALSSSDTSFNGSTRNERTVDIESCSGTSMGSNNNAVGQLSRSTGAVQQRRRMNSPKNPVPFVPKVKRVSPKGFGKRPLPKRMPPPMIKEADIRPSKPSKDISRRELELAKLKSTLLESRAAIGKRWHEAWQSSQSIISGDFSSSSSRDTSGDSSSFAELKSFRLSSEELTRNIPGTDSFQAKSTNTLVSSSEDIFKELLGRDASSDSADADQRSINLTSSEFITNLSSEPSKDVSYTKSSSFQTEDAIPRPFRGLKVRLFTGDEQESESSILSSTNLDTIQSIGALQNDSTSSSSGIEHDHDITGTDTNALEDRRELLDVQKSGDDQPPQSTNESWTETVEYSDDDEMKPNPIQRLVKGPKQLPWTKTRKHDMEVDGKLDEMASKGDFDRREIADSLEFQSKEPLTSNIEKLRRERLMLAHWAKKINEPGALGTEKLRTDAMQEYRQPLVRPAKRNVKALFNNKESVPPLTAELSPRGGGIKERLGERALLPSTRVWQLEQQHAKLQQKARQQSRKLGVLQAAVRNEDVEEHKKDSSDAARDSDGDLTPRTAELMVYEEQCSFLKRKADEQGEYNEAYREQLKSLTLKHFALRRRHGDACEAIRELRESERQHALKTNQAFDQIEDLKMIAVKEENNRVIETSCRQQLEHQSLSLQDRYEQVLHYLQELEEKRSAYEDAMRVALSNCQKAEAMLQIKEEEAAYAKHYMEKQDAQMLEKEVLRRKECDRANMAEKTVEDMKQMLLEMERELEVWKARQKETERTFEQAQKAHAESQNLIEEKDAVIQQKEKEINILRLEMSEAKKFDSNLRRRAHLLDKLIEEFDTVATAATEQDADITAWREALEEKRQKLANIVDDACGLLSKVSSHAGVQPPDHEALHSHLTSLRSELSSQVGTLRLARSQEVEMHRQEIAALEGECKRLSEALNTTETQRQKLENTLNVVDANAKIEKLKNKSALARIAQCAHAQGRSGFDPIVREMKVVFLGTIVELLSGKDHLPEPKYMKIVDGTNLCWTDDLTGTKGFSIKHGININNIIGVDFGPSSAAFGWTTELAARKSKASKRTLPPPWRCFSVRTLKGSYDFRARSDYEAEAWVVTLGRLCGTQGSPAIKCRNEFIVRQVRLKLNAYAKQRGVSLCVVWKEAIIRTLAQLPQLRERATKSKQREYDLTMAEESDVGKIRSSKQHRGHSDSAPSTGQTDNLGQTSFSENKSRERGEGESSKRHSARGRSSTGRSHSSVAEEHSSTADVTQKRRSRRPSVDSSLIKGASPKVTDTGPAKSERSRPIARPHKGLEAKGERHNPKNLNKTRHAKGDFLDVVESVEGKKKTWHHSAKDDKGKTMQTCDLTDKEREMQIRSPTHRDESKLIKKNSIKKMLIKASTMLKRATTKNN